MDRPPPSSRMTMGVCPLLLALQKKIEAFVIFDIDCGMNETDKMEIESRVPHRRQRTVCGGRVAKALGNTIPPN